MTTTEFNRLQSPAFMDDSQTGPSAPAEKAQSPRSGKKPQSGKRLFAALAVVAGIGAASRGLHREAVASPIATTLPSVAVSEPLQRPLETRLGFLGQFAAVDRVELRAQVGGTLTGISFKDGDVVREGAVLFTIDPTPYEIKLSQVSAQLESAVAKQELAQQELGRVKQLKKSNAVSAENVDQREADQRAAEAAVNEAKALVRDAKFDLDHTTIKAPFTGRIGTHLVSIGNLISGSRAGSGPTTLLTTIVSLSPIYLNFDMSEADYLTFARQREKDKGALANKVAVSLSDEKDFSREGALDFIDNTIDRASGTIHARATLPNKDLLLVPGGFGRVRLALSAPEPVLLLPDASVLPDQSSHLVLTLDSDNIVKPKSVEVGDLRGGLRVIRSGLAAGDRVVVDGIPTTVPGSKVNPTAGLIKFNSAQD